MAEKAHITHINKKVIFGIPIYLEKKEKEEPRLFHLRGFMIFLLFYDWFSFFFKLLYYLEGVDKTTLW